VASEAESDKAATRAYREQQKAAQPSNLQGGGATVSIAPAAASTPKKAPVKAPSAPRVPSLQGGGATVSISSAAPGGASPRILDEELARQYGMTLGMLNAYPELKSLFSDMVKEGWTQAKFNAKLAETQWYKSLSDVQRKAILLQYTDPATYGKLWNTTQNKIRMMMADIGADPDNWDQINSISAKIIHEGYTDDQARDFLGQYIVFGSGGMAGGKAGQVQQELNSYMYAMGVQNSDQWTQDAVRNVVRGKKTSQDYKNDILEQTVATFGGWEKQLRAGATMQDLAQPYMQSMGQILEIPGGQINLFDNTIRGALSWRDPSGTAGSKPLWQFQNDLRQDERWKKTQNAQDSAMGTAHKVLQDFGVVY
jgi:hypothetical protein